MVERINQFQQAQSVQVFFHWIEWDFFAWNRGVHFSIPRNVIAIPGHLQVDNITGIVGIYI